MLKEKILIVEANEKDKGLLEISLKKVGYSVYSADSPDKAMEIIESSIPSLIVSNTKFPNTSGFDFCYRIKKDPNLQDVSFIFLTPEKQLDKRIKAIELGADDYLQKPLYLREIVTRIKIFLEKKDKEKLGSSNKEKHFTGNLEDMGIIDLIQSMELGQKTGIIYLFRAHLVGKIYFYKGKIINAIVGDLIGESALYRMLGWNEGTFKMDFREIQGTEETINISTQGLLMEGMRRLDEIERYKEQLPPFDTKLDLDNEVILEEHPDKFPEKIETILSEFNGTHTLKEVLDSLKIDDIEALEIISKLYFQGYLIPIEEDKDKTDTIIISKFDLFEGIEDEEDQTNIKVETKKVKISQEEMDSMLLPENPDESGIFEMAPPEEESSKSKNIQQEKQKTETTEMISTLENEIEDIEETGIITESENDTETTATIEKVDIPLIDNTVDNSAKSQDIPEEINEKTTIPVSLDDDIETTSKKGLYVIILLLGIILSGVFGYIKFNKNTTVTSPYSMRFKKGIDNLNLDTITGYNSAINFFSNINVATDKDYRPYYYLAIAYLRLGNKQNSEKIKEKGRKIIKDLYLLYPNNRFIDFLQAEYDIYTGNYENSFAKIKKYITDSNYYQPYLIIGYYYLKDPTLIKTSIEYFSKTIKLNPSLTLGYQKLGEALFMSGKFEEALNQLQKTVRISPNHIISYIWLGKTAEKLRQYNSAELYYNDALSIDKNNIVAKYYLGKLYFDKLKNKTKGLKLLQNVWNSNKNIPMKLDAGFTLAEVLNTKGNIIESSKILNQIIAIDPNYTNALNLYDQISNSKQFKQKKVELTHTTNTTINKNNYHKTNNLTDKKVNLLIEKATKAYDREDYSKALNYLRKAEKTAKNNYKIYLLYGRIYINLGKDIKAKKMLKKSIRMNPKDPLGHVHLGSLYYSLGNKKLAIKEYHTYLRLAPDGKYTGEVKTIIKELKNGR